MISRNEYKYIKAKIDQIQQTLFEFKVSPMYLAWENYIHLTKQEKELQLASWRDYYATCRESFWGQAFTKLRELFPYGDVKSEIEELKEKGKDVKEIEKPDGVDPEYLLYKMGGYYVLKSKLEQLQKLQEEFASVYATKGGLL